MLAQITPQDQPDHPQQPGQSDRRRGAARTRSSKLVAGLEKHPNVAVMSDEIYSQMLYGGREHESFLRYPEIRTG